MKDYYIKSEVEDMLGIVSEYEMLIQPTNIMSLNGASGSIAVSGVWTSLSPTTSGIGFGSKEDMEEKEICDEVTNRIIKNSICDKQTTCSFGKSRKLTVDNFNIMCLLCKHCKRDLDIEEIAKTERKRVIAERATNKL